MLELEPEVLVGIAKQAGFEARLEDGKRTVWLDLTATGREAPLLLFDAADPGNLGWFSRCQFYVDGQTGHVLQTPITVANRKDRSGRPIPDSIKVQFSKELPVTFRLPGKSPVTEQMVYAVFLSFLSALQHTGVGVCGGPIVTPLAGRTEAPGPRN
ncbi:MAG TPA: hypothetical protein VHA11_13670 [Bryobacteraceae bacterium]|nr:hypothetical protein [Bryobacteraceae bacterium]